MAGWSGPGRLVALVLVMGLAGAAPAPGRLDRLVADHVAALGGLPAIHALHSFVKHGTYVEGDFSTPTYTAQMRPFYRVIGSPERALTSIHEGYDGSAWEYYPDPGIVVRTVGAAAAATRHSAAFDDPLVDYASAGTTLADGGRRTVDGDVVDVVHATLADGFEEDLYLDAATHLIDGIQRIVPMHAFGQKYTTHDRFGDYRPEGGVMMAHTDAEVDSATGKVLDHGTLVSVEINPDLPVSMFSPPQWERTPLQQMIQRIYDERDEPAAVLATYRALRSIVTVPTGDAVDFVGYQCLKMGHADTAIALLSRNVADNPGSARAHFGLGRALASGGRSADAAREFERTLALDPTFVRARTALDALK